jgi:hypothetical protein
MSTSTSKSIAGYDFYFKTFNPASGKAGVHHVRLYGPSAAYIESIRPQYKKEGFVVIPSDVQEYRAANWKSK